MEQFQTIVDVGANMGSFAVYAAQQSPAARIYCYEPSPQNFTLLKRNIAINSLGGRVKAFQCAIASTSGPREMAVGVSPLNTLLPGADGCPRLPVDCITVGDILKSNQLDVVDLMKINCEGAEHEILENLSDADFDRIANIRLEYHDLDSPGRNGEALARLLENRGYRLERFKRQTETSGLFKRSGFIWARREVRHRQVDLLVAVKNGLAETRGRDSRG